MVALTACAGSTASEPPPPLVTEPAVVVETEDDAEIEGEVPVWGADLVARVALPEGTLGPRTDVAVDPRGVDAVSWTGSMWKMEGDWDEEIDGGYLDFGRATLDVNGYRVLGFRIEVPAPETNGSGHIKIGRAHV